MCLAVGLARYNTWNDIFLMKYITEKRNQKQRKKTESESKRATRGKRLRCGGGWLYIFLL